VLDKCVRYVGSRAVRSRAVRSRAVRGRAARGRAARSRAVCNLEMGSRERGLAGIGQALIRRAAALRLCDVDVSIISRGANSCRPGSRKGDPGGPNPNVLDKCVRYVGTRVWEEYLLFREGELLL